MTKTGKMTCEWCGADYAGDKFTLCRICGKTQPEQQESMARYFSRQNHANGIERVNIPTGRAFIIDGFRIPEAF